MFSFLEFSSLEATKNLGEKAQTSSDIMQKLTEEMHWIARKTLNDTVSMKVITVVTLFYLPGTFMSVSCATTPKLLCTKLQ
jgi:hypothetical protein